MFPLSSSSSSSPSFSSRLRAFSHRFRYSFYVTLGLLVDGAQKILDSSIILLGPILVVLAWIILCYFFYSYFAHLMFYQHKNPWAFPWSAQTGLGLWILFNIFFNHLNAILRAPGSLPADYPIPVNITSLIDSESLQLRPYQFAQFCSTCVKPKPASLRIHHCKICKKCHIKMDHVSRENNYSLLIKNFLLSPPQAFFLSSASHLSFLPCIVFPLFFFLFSFQHCPWIARCAGYYNYPYFLLFLFYLTLGGFYYFLCTLTVVWENSLYLSSSPHSPSEMAIFLCFLISGSATICVGGFLGFHLFLLFTNQTTIEYYYNERMKKRGEKKGEFYENPYDLGWKANFHQVFGVSFYSGKWLIPFLWTIKKSPEFPMKNSSDQNYGKNKRLKEFYNIQQNTTQGERDLEMQGVEMRERHTGEDEKKPLLREAEESSSALKDR